MAGQDQGCLQGSPADGCCERCGVSLAEPLSPGMLPQAPPAFQIEAAGLPCLFCQETNGISYVPLHMPAVRPRPRRHRSSEALIQGPLLAVEDVESQGAPGVPSPSAPSCQEEDQAARSSISAAARPRAALIVEYSAALESHRGCAQCWLTWEAQRSTRGGRHLGTHCPVCDFRVDIRTGYNAVLCKPCQEEVVAHGTRVQSLAERLNSAYSQVQHMLGCVLLCVAIAAQALVTMIFWALAQELILSHAGKNSKPAGSGAVKGPSAEQPSDMPFVYRILEAALTALLH